MLIFSYPSVLTYDLGAQKNHLIETVLLSTHNSPHSDQCLHFSHLESITNTLHSCHFSTI